MVEVNGRPFLEHVLSGLHAAGIELITLCTGYRADAVSAFCEAQYGGSRIECIATPEPAGDRPVDALHRVRERLAEDCLLVNAGLLCDPDVLRRLVRMDRPACAVATGQH